MRVSDLSIDRIYSNMVTRNADYKMVENHFHYYYELYYVRQGWCRFFIDNNLYDLHGGDFIVIPPREIHYNRYLSQCTRINIYFKAADIKDDGVPFMPEAEMYLDKITLVHVPSSYRDKVNLIFDSMLQEEKVDDANTGRMLGLLFRELFITCIRYCRFYTDPENPNISSEDNTIPNAARYISEHYNQQISLDSLARQAGLSPTYFSKKFRQTTGMGMKEYLTYVRLEHAAKELLSTTHSITDVAINCGFSDSNYFKDAFKKMYGMSPRAFRNSKSTDSITDQSVRNYKMKRAQEGPHL